MHTHCIQNPCSGLWIPTEKLTGFLLSQQVHRSIGMQIIGIALSKNGKLFWSGYCLAVVLKNIWNYYKPITQEMDGSKGKTVLYVETVGR